MDEDGSPTAFVAPTITATDIDGGTLTWSGTTATNGTATVSGTGASPTITYAPAANFNGTDSFDVTVSDGNGGSDTITVNVTITAQNDAPVIAQAGPLAVNMDEDGSPTAFVAPTITATDVDSGALIWSGTTATNGTATVSGAGASPTITYVPNTNFNGADSFTVTVSDGNGSSATITVNVIVATQNDAPVIAQTGPLTVNMDEDGSPTAFVAPTITATDVDSGTLTWSGTTATNGTATVSGTGASPAITYAPNADFNGADSFTVTVSDGNGGSDTITVNVTVAAQSDAPVIAQTGPLTVNMDEDGSPTAFVAPTVTATDVDGDTLTWSGTAATNGTATVSGTGASPTITYAPNADFNGADSFDVTVSDGGGGNDTITVNVTVNAQNDAPVIAQQPGPLTVNMDEDGSPTAFVAPTITATDVDGGTLTWSGTAAGKGTATVSGIGASPTITYAPNADFNGADSFAVTVSDGSGGSDTITVDVTVTAQPDLPTIGGSPLTTAVDGILYSFTPTANDADGDTLVFSIVGRPSWAVLNTSSGTLSGTPGPGDVGGSFTNIIIIVTAGGDAVNLAPFSITVNAAQTGTAVWNQFSWDDGSTWQ